MATRTVSLGSGTASTKVDAGEGGRDVVNRCGELQEFSVYVVIYMPFAQIGLSLRSRTVSPVMCGCVNYHVSVCLVTVR